METNSRPLGFISFVLPGVDSPLPMPCARVVFPTSAVGRINYLVVAVSMRGREGEFTVVDRWLSHLHIFFVFLCRLRLREQESGESVFVYIILMHGFIFTIKNVQY